VHKGSKQIVITGGIGSGKSYVVRQVASLGWELIEADQIGHAVLRSDGAAFLEVAHRWPEVVCEGEIQRSELANLVFADQGELEELETITHPYIQAEIFRRLRLTDRRVVVELPVEGLLAEWPRVVVGAPRDLRIERLAARGMDPDDAFRRMEAQPSRARWVAAADFVFNNGGDVPFSDEFERLKRWLETE